MASNRPLRRLVPTLWAAGCLLGFAFPGDEYGLFGLGSILGVWVLMFFGDLAGPAGGLLPALVVGTAVAFGLGALLELLRVRQRMWIAIWLAASATTLAVALQQFDSYAAAIQKNGSLAAYVVAASQTGLLASCLVCALGGAVKGWWRMLREDLSSRTAH